MRNPSQGTHRITFKINFTCIKLILSQSNTLYEHSLQLQIIFQKKNNRQSVGLEAVFVRIEEWLGKKQQTNTPLVLRQHENVEHQVLISKWIVYHQSQSKRPDIIIPYFTTEGNRSYFYAIYYILVKMRQALNIRQKVELQEEKLRQYFEYWVGICSRELENLIINDAEVLYQRVILILEGIDMFKEPNGEDSKVSFWLPRILPENFKVIVTAGSSAKCIDYFLLHASTIIDASIDGKYHRIFQSKFQEAETIVMDSTKKAVIDVIKTLDKSIQFNQQFLRVFLSLLLPTQQYTNVFIDYDQITLAIIKHPKMKSSIIFNIKIEMKKFEDFFSIAIDCFSNILPKQEIIRVMKVLCSTKNGLTYDEIQQSSEIQINNLNLFIYLFKFFLIKSDDTYSLTPVQIRRYIELQFIQSSSEKLEIIERIIHALDKSENSIRRLDELTYHLYQTGQYFKLKETVINIENFQLLFNPLSKFDLCRYWQKLEEIGFDLVMDYNKALETFTEHYRPQSEELFWIVLQLCRFLREFSDFESFLTPDFKHPLIIGHDDELKDIGLLYEIQHLNLYFPIRHGPKKIKEKEEKLKSSFTEKNLKQSKISKMQPSEQPSPSKVLANNSQLDLYFPNKKRFSILVPGPSQIQNVRLTPMSKSSNKSKSLQKKSFLQDNKSKDEEYKPNQNQLEPLSTDQLIQQYTDQIVPLFEEMNDIKQEDEQSPSQIIQYLYQLEREDSLKMMKLPKRKVKISQIVDQLLKKHIKNKVRQPSDYYYKRWLWVQFPWVCMSFKQNYSDKMKLCFSSANEYMSCKEENLFSQNALKVAFEAKMKKKMMIDPSALKNQAFIINQSAIRSLSQNSQADKPTSSFILEDPYQLPRIRKALINKTDESVTFLTQDMNDETMLRMKFKPIKLDSSVDGSKEITKQLDITQILSNRSANGILPYLKIAINQHKEKEIGYLQGQKGSLQKSFDYYIYKNKTLRKKLDELQGLVSMQNYRDNPIDIEKTKQQINSTEKEIQYWQIQVSNASSEKHRMKLIIKICKENHTTNEDWIKNMNHFLTNLTYARKQEERTIENLNQQIENIIKTQQQYQSIVIQKIDQTKQLIDVIQKNVIGQKVVDNLFQNASLAIQQEANQTKRYFEPTIKEKKINRKPSMSPGRKIMPDSRVQNQERLELLRQSYQEILTMMELPQGTVDIERSQPVRWFKQQIQRRNDLLSESMEKERHLLQLKIQLQQGKNRLLVINIGYENSESQLLKRTILKLKFKKKFSKIEEIEIDQFKNNKQIQADHDDAVLYGQQRKMLLKTFQQTRTDQIFFMESIRKKLQISEDNQFDLKVIMKQKLDYLISKLPQEYFEKYLKEEISHTTLQKILQIDKLRHK